MRTRERIRASMHTAYTTPWALVIYGAQTPGVSPGTRLGFITKAMAKDGVIVAYRVYTFSPRGQTQQRPKTYPTSSMLRTWKHCPTTAQLQAARRALQPSPTPDTPQEHKAPGSLALPSTGAAHVRDASHPQ